MIKSTNYNRDDNSKYSQNFEEYVSRYYSYALGKDTHNYKNNSFNNTNKDYYTINNYEFSKLNKNKGDNRQLHKDEMKKIKELSKLYAKKKNISLDEATNVIAKGYYALVDNDANEFYIKNLDEDKAVEVLNSQDFIKNNLDYSKTAFIDNNELTGVGFATKEQYYNRYSNLKGYVENKDFYNKYLGIDGITNNTKISSLNLVQGVYKPYKDLAHQVITNPLNTAKDMLIAMLNPINSGYEYGNNLRQTYEKANLDKFLNDTTNTNRHYGEITGSLAPVVIPSVGVGISKGIKSGSKVYKDLSFKIDNKIVSNINSSLPKGYKFDTTKNVIINSKNQEFIQVGYDSITKQPIYGQIKNEKLTGNYKMFVNNKSISTTKPINYTIPDNAYWFGNTISDPRVWIYGTAGFEIANDIFNDSTTPGTQKGTLGAIIKNMYQNIKKRDEE